MNSSEKNKSWKIPEKPDTGLIGQAEGKIEEFFGKVEVPSHFDSSDNLVGNLQTEIKFQLWQLSKLENLHKEAMDELLISECKLVSELDRLHLLGARFINPADHRGAQLKDRLAQLKEKSNILEMNFFDRQCRCLEKLVALVGRHKMLK